MVFVTFAAHVIELAAKTRDLPPAAWLIIAAPAGLALIRIAAGM